METCVICHQAYDSIVAEDGQELLDFRTDICVKCQRKIEAGEILVEDYDDFSFKD